MKRENTLAFSFSDLEEIHPTPRLNLPDLDEEACYKPKDGTPYYVFKCKPLSRTGQVCPSCSSPIVSIHGYLPKRRLVHDVNVGIEQVDLLVEAPRYRCEKCGSTFTHKFDSIIERRQMTHRLADQLRRDVFVRPFSDIAKEFGYSVSMIGNIFDEYASELEKKRGPVVAPRILGIDEKHIVDAMRAVFVDIKNGQLLEMTESNKRADVMKTIESMVDYDKNIKIVTMDMSNGYRSYVRECLPKAKIVVDKYHIYQDLGLKVKKTRTRILEYLKAEIKKIPNADQRDHMRDVYNLVATNSYLFKFGPEKLEEKPERLTALADVCRTFPEFNHLKLLKEGFELIYDCSDRKAAEGVFAEWEKLVPPNGVRKMEEWRKTYKVPPDLYSEFRIFQNAIKNWREEIFIYFEPGYNVTNATTEGLNNMIERFNRLGNGYGFRRLRAKALCWHLARNRMAYTIDQKEVSAPRSNARRMYFAVPDADFFGLTPTISLPRMKIPSIKGTEIGIKREPLSVFHYLPKDYIVE